MEWRGITCNPGHSQECVYIYAESLGGKKPVKTKHKVDEIFQNSLVAFSAALNLHGQEAASLVS